MVVALGADAAVATRLFHQNVRDFFLNLNVGIGGGPFPSTARNGIA